MRTSHPARRFGAYGALALTFALPLAASCGEDESSSPSSGGAGSSNGGTLNGGGSLNRGGESSVSSGGTSAGGGEEAGYAGVGEAAGGTNGRGGAGSARGGAGPSSGGAGAASGGVSASGGTAEGGSPASGGAGGGLDACSSLRLERNVQVASTATDRFTWSDAQCRPRTAAMARVGGGYVRQYSYEVNGKNRVATGTGANGHKGWGYTVNHVNNSAWIGQDHAGTYRPVFVGAHHALYEYAFEVNPGVFVTLRWLFATGRDHPLLAIHYDLSATAPGLNADTRTPYGDIAWDGDDNAATTEISGVGWGDRYRFVTTTAPLTMNSKWTYDEPNVVPHVYAWADKSDAEMGIVQTQAQKQHDGGGYWFYSNWRHNSENQTKSQGQIGNMPVTWNWTYQINQYELCVEDPACLNATTRSHRLAWGTNYGALGGTDASGEYNVYGDDRKVKGYPYQSYSVFMVLGRHTTASVLTQVQQVELLQGVSLTATLGTVATALPSGVGTTPDVPTDPPGYDARYATFNLSAVDNQAIFRVQAPPGVVRAPIVVLSDYTAKSPPSAVRIDGALAVASRDYFASVDSERHELWITFARGWSMTRQIEIE